MARPPQFRISAIGDLYQQLRFAPPQTRLRQMDHAEALLAQTEPDQTYPLDYVVFRITGYREEHSSEAISLAGAALIGDLAAFIQRLSADVTVPPDYAQRTAVAVADLPRRLNVSPRTLKRYRRQGLVCHYVDFDAQTKRLACFEDALERFLRRHGSKVDRAATFSRVEPDIERRIIDEAATLRRESRFSLNKAAATLAEKYGRAHETVRGILRRHDRASNSPIFTDRGPLSPRERRVIGRASRWGVPAKTLARRFGRTATTIRRAINEDRAIFLRSLNLTGIALPTFELDDAERVILSARAATTKLNETLPADFALPLIEAARAGLAHARQDEDAMLAAYNFLKRQAKTALERGSVELASGVLDEIETKLRWAALLKRRLACFALGPAIIAIERNLHKPLVVQPTETILSMLHLAMQVVSRTIETIDPGQEQTLERMSAFAMDRALAARGSATETRAAARHDAAGIALRGLFDRLTPWQRRLALRPDWAIHLHVLDDDEGGQTDDSSVGGQAITSSELVELRFGLAGEPPRTIAQLARMMHATPTHVARRMRRALNRLRDLHLRSGT